MDAVRVVDPAEASRLAAAGALVLDVRDDREWAAGRVPGSRHVPLFDLPDRVGELDPAVAVVCVCRAGERSRRAAAFLAERGFDAASLDGGVVAWARTGLDLAGDGAGAVVL